ncbi:hypothetical protein SAMN06295987_104339 [Novosphingobium mathurense]|uniref:Uncharacterized protein n=2 Tax=Sphingomonadaceae TaxID=41297 RepID=A0A1U6I7Q8_9SPHN|nr:hypothetical protein SAMN06295987_104339 [Novosphingobium mathurense]
MNMTDGRVDLLVRAREAAARYFDGLDRSDLSRLALGGGGDDLSEVQVAASLLKAEEERLSRYEGALRQYADRDFWDETMPGGPLALHDGGEMARNVLAGRAAFFHRD